MKLSPKLTIKLYTKYSKKCLENCHWNCQKYFFPNIVPETDLETVNLDKKQLKYWNRHFKMTKNSWVPKKSHRFYRTILSYYIVMKQFFWLITFLGFQVYLTGTTFILTPIVYLTGGQTLLGGYPTFLGLLGVSSLALLISGEWMRRVIGIIYIDKTDLKTVRFSHISFWGKRKELLINIDDIKFLSDTSQKETANHNVFWKVQFYDPKLSTMFISTKYGGITDPDKFR